MIYLELNVCDNCNHAWAYEGYVNWSCPECGDQPIKHRWDEVWHEWYYGEEQGLLLICREREECVIL